MVGAAPVRLTGRKLLAAEFYCTADTGSTLSKIAFRMKP